MSPIKDLLKKLEGYGIKGILLEWFKKFLNGRQQRVVLNGKTSNWTNVLSGIPQGSILGPVLFIIFINDLPGVVGNVCKLFADDCKLYKNIKSEAGLKELQEDIYRLCQWSKEWFLLGFNFKKCKINSYRNYQFEYEYYMIDNQNNFHKLSKEDSECDVGVLFKTNLKFDEHIDNTVNKVNRIIG